MEIANITKQRILEYLKSGKRFDGRELLEYREIKIEKGISKKAEGSAKVKIGNTEVIAGVKLDIATPFVDSPDSGVLMVTAEFSPMASERFERGPPGIEAIELARIVDRGIRESGIIDLKKLCIKKGEKVWAIFLDIYPINDSGNLIDAAALAAVLALKTAVFPETENKEKVKYGELTNKKLPLSDDPPLTLTFYKLGSSFILDPVTEEEEASEARLSIAISGKKQQSINALQKGGSTPFTEAEVHFIIDSALKEWKKLYSIFEKGLK